MLTTLEERLVELRHTPPPRPRSREERLEEERRIVREIVAGHRTRSEQLAVWRLKIGGQASDRRFDRRLAEIRAEDGAAA